MILPANSKIDFEEENKYGYKWITASCFLEIAQWRYLLCEIKQVTIEFRSSFKFFQVKFNYENGPNIRVLTLVEIHDFESMLCKIRQRFTNFFKLFPEKGSQLPITSIFLPFPSSMIEFELYNKGFNIESSNFYEIEEKITYLLFDIFESEELSETVIITAAFYLQISLIKFCLEKAAKIGDLLKLTVVAEGKVLGRRSLSNFLTDSQPLLLEIVNDIMNQEKHCHELEWIKKCNDLCYKLFQLEDMERTSSSNYCENVVGRFYSRTILMIYDFLGLTNDLQILLNHLVVSSLQNYRDEN